MGACATKFNVLKDTGDAPAPEVAMKEITVAEVEVKKEEAAVTENDEANHHSLGHLLKDKEKEGEEAKHEEAVADAPLKAESDIVPVTDAPHADETEVDDKQVVESPKTEKLEEKKQEMLEAIKTTEEQKPAADAEKSKA